MQKKKKKLLRKPKLKEYSKDLETTSLLINVHHNVWCEYNRQACYRFNHIYCFQIILLFFLFRGPNSQIANYLRQNRNDYNSQSELRKIKVNLLDFMTL